MRFIGLLAALGAGIIITKLLDILWLQKIMQESEKKKWLRDKRLKVFSELTKELLSIGAYKESYDSLWNGYIFMSEAILLVEDDELAKRIEEFFERLAKFGRKVRKDASSEQLKEGRKMFEELREESKKIVKDLKKGII